MANPLNFFRVIGNFSATLKQQQNCKEPEEPGQQNGGYDNAVQGIDRQQHIIFSLDGLDYEPMLHQSQQQQHQPHSNKHQAGNLGNGCRHQRIPIRKPLPQAARNLLNGDADTDKTQAVANPGVHGALSGGPVTFFGQLVGSAKQFLRLGRIHWKFVESMNIR